MPCELGDENVKKVDQKVCVLVVLDGGMIYRSQKTIVREEPTAEEEGKKEKYEEDRMKCYSEYKVKGEFLYTRPFLEEYLRSLLQKEGIEVKLCMNIDRPRLISLAMQLFSNKKLKEYKKKVTALLDERFFLRSGV